MTRLFLSYYQDKNEARQKELDECLLKNISNPLIDEMHLLLEYPCDEETINNKKIFKVHVKARPSYSVFFDYINTVARPEDISILANSDIYFDETLSLLDKYTDKNVLALCRYDIKKDKAVFMNRWDSQDTWIFKGKIRQVPDSDFQLGKAGCLSGDTVIYYNRGKRAGGRYILLKHLYKRFNGITNHWDLCLNTHIQSFNINDKSIFYNKIERIVESGIKKTMKLTFDDGNNITLTSDHPVLMSDFFYKEAGRIVIGDSVLGKGTMRPVSSGRKRRVAKRVVVYLKYHPFAENKIVRGHKYKRVRRYRLVYEASMNNMDYDTFLYILRNDEELSKTLKFLDPKMEVHHKDENTLNDSLNNLEVLDKVSHSRLHSRVENFNRDDIKILKVLNIEHIGEMMTYDIQMKSPHHNFCANDVFVHNCDNAIANRLYRAGYNVINPSRTIKTYHLHESQIHNYNPSDRIPEPYKLITPTA